jgi:hypothetical protein
MMDDPQLMTNEDLDDDPQWMRNEEGLVYDEPQ